MSLSNQNYQQNEFLQNLNSRSQEIFKTLVERYLETGDPVGSRQLSRVLPNALSPASVRNVMADLEELGLIAAPHTSAGRAPTQLGLRFFVDAMLEIGSVETPDRKQIEKQIQSSSDRDGSIEDLLTEASQLLSGLTQGAGVVIASKSDIRLSHIEFVRLEPEKAMAILVGDDGSIENRIIPLPKGLPNSALVEASNYLAAHIIGKTLAEARRFIGDQKILQQTELDNLTRKLIEAGMAHFGGSAAEKQPTLIVRGRANLIDDTMASSELELVRMLFDELEAKKGLIDLLSSTEQSDGVRIFIGSENKLFSLSGSSVILSPYRDGEQNVVGVLGVIGPTRLNYARIVPVVDYTAQVVTKIINK